MCSTMDRTLEARAAHFFQRGLYTEALQAYTDCISALPKSSKPEVRTNLIFNRSACYLKLKKFQQVVEDCNLILSIDGKHEKALGRKIKAMCSLGKFSEAQSLAHQWIQSDPTNQQAVKELERLNVIVKALKEQEDEDNIIMGSSGKNSPLHSKVRMPSPQSIRQGSAWNSAQPRPGSIGTTWQQHTSNSVSSAWGIGSGGSDSWGQSLQMTIRGQESKETVNNSVWGMAINTTWGDAVDDKNSASDFPALSCSSLSNSNKSGKTGLIGGNAHESTSLVWTNNPLSSSSSQHLSGVSNSSQVPPYHIHNPHNAQTNPLSDVLYNGNSTRKQTESTLFSLIPKTQSDNEMKSQNPELSLHGITPAGSSHGLEQDLSTLWSNLAPLNDRQKPLSPPWGKSANVQSKFPFAQKDNKLDEQNTQSNMLWNTQSLHAGGSETFPDLRTEDTFSALKSLISSAPKTAASMTFPSFSTSNTDKLLLQHMQRNTGPQQPLQTSSALSSHGFSKSEIVDRLSKAGSMEENISPKSAEQSTPLVGTAKASAIGHSFIPPVIQAQMLIGKKTETVTTTFNTGTPRVIEGGTGHSLHGLETSLPNGVDMSSVKGMSNSASLPVTNKPLVLQKESTKLDGSGNYSVSSADESVISSSGSTGALDTTSESITLKEDDKAKTTESDKLWKFRPPPRGLTSQEYTKCPRYQTFGMCSFGENCSQAHSDDELKEWKERFEERKKQLLMTKETEKQGETYSDRLMEKLMRTENAASVMTDGVVDGVNIHVNSNLSITTQTKKSSHSWLCTVTSKMFLHKVVLIGDESRKHYHISSITMGPKKPKKNQKVMKVTNHCQEWDNPEFKPGKFGTDKVFRIKVTFKTDIFGTFRQSVVFDFGVEPVVVRYLCVDSCPVTDLDQLNKDLILSQSGRWDIGKLNVIEFSPKIFMTDEAEKNLLEQYPAPTASKIAEVSQSLLEPTLTKENYKKRLHNMLNIEEMAQFSSIAKFNVQTSLQLVKSFMLMPSTVSTAKYAVNGQLFARMELTSDLSEDTSHGRLILQNVYTVYLAPCKKTNKGEDEVPEKVYEAMIEEKGKNFIFLKLSENCVEELNLKVDGTLYAQVQFQLNRMPLCEMHLAVDKLTKVETVFPSSTFLQQQYPWGTQLTSEDCDDRLNEKQKEAVSVIIANADDQVPPVLLIGPYGTGKTFTLAQAAKQILKQEGTRVLICTHSNSAADLYIRDYLHPYVVDGHTEAFPLRIYYRHRWVQTVSPVVLQYCLTRVDEARGTVFVDPKKTDVEKKRVLVATFSTCRQLYNLGLPKDFFSHILLDEAAQALECETLMPLALAGEKTRIVLAGDHMQLSPEIHSEFAKDRNFHISLLERLYDLYPHKFACKIMLCENYRSHKAIIDFTSELFYESKLLASGNQPRHDRFYPLTFFTARGEDTQHQNSTAYYNNAEVYEIVERVSEVQRFWPKTWGSLDETSIGVVSPYTDQVVRIRAELRKKKLHHVSVERVLNVQGKQFRVIFLSTVRTRKTCSSDTALEEFIDYGFLSNMKLLNTAITRAQSMVAVVGDPVSLCSIGKCRKLWERFLEICTSNNSMYGMTWRHLRAQLDGVELKKTYILNPLAPEFVPNRLRHTQYAPPEPIAYGRYGFTFAPTSQFNQHAMGIPPNMSWQNNPRLMQMMPPMLPQMYLNPALQYQYMAMLQGGLGNMGYGPPLPPTQNMNPYIANMKGADPKVDPRKGQYFLPRQASQKPVSSQHSSAGVSNKPKEIGNEVHSEEEVSSNNRRKDEINHEEVRSTKPVVSTQPPSNMAGLHHQQPPGRINPMYFPPQYQRVPGLPPHNVIPPPPYHPLLNAGGRGYSLSPYALGAPQLSGLMSPGKVAAQSHHRGVPTLPPAIAIKNMHSPSLSPRSNRSGSMSPNRMIAASNSNVEFLPKAMNVRNLPSSDDRKGAPMHVPPQGVPAPLMQSYSGGVVSKVVPKAPVNTSIGVTQAQSLMKSPFLQQELYSYIMQTEGQGAAENFVSSFATHPPVAPERPQSHQLHQTEHVQLPSQGHQGHPLHHSHSVPTFMPSEYPTNIPPPYIARNPHKSNEPIRSSMPGQQFMAQDLERQWQEESLRDHGHGHYEQLKDQEITGIIQQDYSKYSDRSGKPIYNQNFEYVAEQFLMPKRQSPFGDGPQPYSRQKMFAEAHRDSQERQPDEYGSNGHSLVGSRPGSQNSERHTNSNTSALSVDVDQSGTVIEKELGQIHIDSPVAASLSPPGATSGERKAPLYMRRVKDDSLPPPRLSYAGALRSHNQTDSAENTPPTATPQTMGPYTPEDFPLYHNNADKEQDPLELLRNLNIKESPGTQALFQYFS